MKYRWLNKLENKKVIVFFNGWGMDESVVTHLEPENYDVVMFYDYNTLDTDFDFSILATYSEKYLISWSMGVMCATLFEVDYNSSTAINGTLCPIDDCFGIPKRIYDLTIRGFSPAGRDKFIKNMFNIGNELPDVKRDFEAQKSELVALKGYSANSDFKYSKVFISSSDKIIPTKNQVMFWQQEPNLDSGHCPFYLFKKWSELL